MWLFSRSETDDEKRPSFTTSEIAKIINDLLSKTSQKHKDNVSRYFNQNFYAYYEIEIDPTKGTRRYRLSKYWPRQGAANITKSRGKH
ncbi:hypothetical protein CUJ84_pRLN2000283 (plasmid) [Rhizobium leguminosarum]|uniref:Uncharacterized protein n=1 Tax=Rhizobium leguminosarum TaxID=384 RepID=A0A2K9ZEY5_RHILE|nr:hypothetical protein CUJ84_pRLN2000283 [Rhizobium leguminosarum]